MNLETILHVAVPVACVSALFWRVVGKLQLEVAVLQAELRSHVSNEGKMKEKIEHIDKTLSEVSEKLTGLLGVLKGKSVINGDLK